MSVSALLQNSRCYACYFQYAKHNVVRILARQYSSVDTEEIVVPNKIPRGPTDILKALASTIRRDPTAPHYKFHDDPYLIPISNSAKRTFALSQESGRKAALWVKEQHPELFQRVEADPPIEAFLAKPAYDQFDDVDEMTLLKTMRTASVNDSIQIYELMVKTNKSISEEIKLCLLELLCFFNVEEQLVEELIEERWFSLTSDRKMLKKTWKDNGYAEKLFSELPPSPRSYSAIIMGMVKYFQLELAYEYYQDAVAKGFALSPDTYNSMIKVTNFLKESWVDRWEFIESVLSTMNESGCKPSVQTLNRVLEILCRNPGVPQGKSLALRMIAEVKRFGVEPSLGSYNYLLNLFCKVGQHSEKEPSYILEDILDEIEGKSLFARDISDSSFFCNAMEKCRFYYNNSDIAFRLNRLLWHGKNYNLIGECHRESVYYRHFFLLLCQGETLETIMKQYNFYVPNIYTPEMSVLQEIVNVVTLNGAIELYPRLWTDIVQLEMATKESVVSTLLKGMVMNRIPLSTPPADMAIKLADIAYSIFSKTEKDYEMENNMLLEWTGEMLGDIVLLCLCADHFERAKDVFQKIMKDRAKIVSTPCTESVEMMLDACIKRNEAKLAIMIAAYCNDSGYIDDKKYAKKVVQEMHLSPSYATHMAAIFGQSIFKPDEKVQALKA